MYGKPVDSAKTTRIVTDFLDQFKVLEGGQERAEDLRLATSLSSMNRCEREVVAGGIRVEVNTDSITTDQMRAAIQVA